MLLVLHRSRHGWCVLLDVYACLQLDDLGQGLSCTLSDAHCRLHYLVRTHSHFHSLYYIPLSTIYLYLRVICKDTHFLLT